MAQRNTHVVSATLIVARTSGDPGERYFDKGAVLGDDVNAEEKKRLVGLGLVEIVKVEEASGEPQLTAAQKKAKAEADKVAAEKAEADRVAAEAASKAATDAANGT